MDEYCRWRWHGQILHSVRAKASDTFKLVIDGVGSHLHRSRSLHVCPTVQNATPTKGSKYGGTIVTLFDRKLKQGPSISSALMERTPSVTQVSVNSKDDGYTRCVTLANNAVSGTNSPKISSVSLTKFTLMGGRCSPSPARKG